MKARTFEVTLYLTTTDNVDEATVSTAVQGLLEEAFAANWTPVDVEVASVVEVPGP